MNNEPKNSSPYNVQFRRVVWWTAILAGTVGLALFVFDEKTLWTFLRTFGIALTVLTLIIISPVFSADPYKREIPKAIIAFPILSLVLITISIVGPLTS